MVEGKENGEAFIFENFAESAFFGMEIAQPSSRQLVKAPGQSTPMLSFF
jgi:hypothetical protein